MLKRTLGLGALLLIAAGGCSADSSSSEDDNTGREKIKKFWADPSKVDLGDLANLTVGFASEKLNDTLAGDHFKASLAEPTVYTVPEEATEDLSMKDLGSLVSGLAAQYGDRELTTVVNQTRLDYLRAERQAGRKTVFAESAFQIGGNVGHEWSHAAKGLPDDSTVTVGFDAGASLEARLIAPYGDEIRGNTKSTLQVLKRARNFVYPKSLADIRAMKPGESFALHGAGSLGANVGMSVPFFVSSHDALRYEIVASAAFRAYAKGELDVQVLRLSGNDLVIDVGISSAKEVAARVAIDSRWGVNGLLKAMARDRDTKIKLGPKELDLANILDNPVRDRLNKHLSMHLGLEKAERKGRTSVSRVRFHMLPGVDEELVSKAVAEALHGDIRLAQGLAYRDSVKPAGQRLAESELDLLRGGTTVTRDFGVDAFGMNVYKNVMVRGTGVAVVQTPGGAVALLHNTLHKEHGWFQETHGYTRMGLAGLYFGETPRAETNFVVEVLSRDEHLDNDIVQDNVDAMVLAVGGKKAWEALSRAVNPIEAKISAACPFQKGSGYNKFDDCVVAAQKSPEVKALREGALTKFAQETGFLEAPVQRVLLEAAKQRLALTIARAPSIDEGVDVMAGIPVWLTGSYRLDDAALATAFYASQADFEAALHDYVVALRTDRRKEFDAAVAQAPNGPVDLPTLKAKLGKVFAEHRARWVELNKAVRTAEGDIQEQGGLMGVSGQVGARAIELRVPQQVSASKYEGILMNSVARGRAETAANLFDGLVKESTSRLGLKEEHMAAYTLLALASKREAPADAVAMLGSELKPVQHIDLRFDFRTNTSDEKVFLSRYKNARFREAGVGQSEASVPYEEGEFKGVRIDVAGISSKASRIDGGQYDVSALIKLF